MKLAAMTDRKPPSLSSFVPGMLGKAIDEALQAQATLTAVDRFSSWHDKPEAVPGVTGDVGSALAGWYRDLLPLQAPGPGEQYAFEVDLDRCSGCKACVTACHNLNGLDDEEGESFRDVGLLLDPAALRGPQHITTACHHCLQPACAEGCPVLAYEKEADTGVVRHLDDQCIGCEYCVLKCPYDVPKYHHGKGIVRKCDLCVGRLRAGEAPACVQACPTKAIKVTVVSTTPAQAAEGFGFTLPDAPDPKYTQPTTRYISSKGLPRESRAANAGKLKPEAAHGPLAATLVITQMAFGLSGMTSVWTYFLGDGNLQAKWLLPCMAFGIMNIGLLLGLTHLGKPLMAWKAWMGWRRSWFSREVIVFTAFTGLASAAAALALVGKGAPLHAMLTSLPLPHALNPVFLPPELGKVVSALLAAVVAGVSLLAIGASAMVYIDTPRALWRRAETAVRFFLTCLSSGSALLAATLLALGSTQSVSVLLLIAGAAQIGKLVVEFSVLRFKRGLGIRQVTVTPLTQRQELLNRSALLLVGPQLGIALLRVAVGLAASGAALGLARHLATASIAFSPLALAQFAFLTFGLFLAADFIERHLFFTTAAAPRMPGAF
jgi:formate dehydrogenase iron-sulfur subunit